jgi:hypothetical protein
MTMTTGNFAGDAVPSRPLDDPVLEERVAELEASNDFPPDLASRDWAWVVATTLIIPLVLLVIAWAM